MILALATHLAFATPERAGARLDVGVGASTEGGVAARLGVAPEVWWAHTAVAIRLSYDGDLEPGTLSGEVDFLRFEPSAFLEIPRGVLLGVGLGAARAAEHPGFGGGASTVKGVGTASIVAGWIDRSRWFGVWVRADATTFPTAALVLELTVAPGVPLRPQR